MGNLNEPDITNAGFLIKSTLLLYHSYLTIVLATVFTGFRMLSHAECIA